MTKRVTPGDLLDGWLYLGASPKGAFVCWLLQPGTGKPVEVRVWKAQDGPGGLVQLRTLGLVLRVRASKQRSLHRLWKQLRSRS